jgi:hypothetical protein
MRLDYITNPNNTLKITYIYNADNVSIGNDVYEINTDGTTWDLKKHTALTYNSDDLVGVEIVSNWNGTILTNNKKTEYTYNSDLSINTKTFSNWNTTSNSWEYASTKQYIYNSGLLSQILTLNIVTAINYSKRDYIYNTNILTRIERTNWDESSNDWETNPWKKREYSYDIDGNLTEDIEYYDFERDGVWEVGDVRYEYSYDNNYSIADLLIPFNFDDQSILLPFNNNMITNIEFFEHSSSGWISIGNLTYFYTDITLTTNEHIKEQYTVYPNPTKDEVKFEINDFESIKIYNSNGRLIRKTKFSIINIKELPSGVYLYRIFKGGKIINGKIIKQ